MGKWWEGAPAFSNYFKHWLYATTGGNCSSIKGLTDVIRSFLSAVPRPLKSLTTVTAKSPRDHVANPSVTTPFSATGPAARSAPPCSRAPHVPKMTGSWTSINLRMRVGVNNAAPCIRMEYAVRFPFDLHFHLVVCAGRFPRWKRRPLHLLAVHSNLSRRTTAPNR